MSITTPEKSNPVYVVALALMFLGCGEDSQPDEDPAAATDSDSATPLRGGLYGADDVRFENARCSFFEGTGLLPVKVHWVAERAFELRYDESYNVSTMACVLDEEEAVSCTGFHQEMSSGVDDAAVALDSVTDTFSIASATAFDIAWTWTLSCEGEGCEPWEQALEITTPCTVEVSATFSK